MLPDALPYREPAVHAKLLHIAAAPEFCYRILRYLCENGVQPEIWQDVVEELTDTEQLRQKGGALRGE